MKMVSTMKLKIMVIDMITNFIQFRRTTYEEQVYLRLLMHDTWFKEVKNRSDLDKKLHKSIHQKLSQELINA